MLPCFPTTRPTIQNQEGHTWKQWHRLSSGGAVCPRVQHFCHLQSVLLWPTMKSFHPEKARSQKSEKEWTLKDLENKVGRVLPMCLHREEGHCSGRSLQVNKMIWRYDKNIYLIASNVLYNLPKCCVAITITDTKLVALLGEHNSVHLGKHPSRPSTHIIDHRHIER